jgi:cellulose synthase/poly-beta-1,6-N-acetylglucosamine synthase-like glycosyltransferase
VIVPSYNNEADARYLWNIESILQQDYKNYRAIIVVDLSEDNTVNLLIEYLKWRNVPKEKFILVSSQRRNTALPILYYGIHKYCNPGEIVYMVDGDDELIGTQIFKIYNAIYQK